MAGDWIPMRCDLADDPAVIAMVDRLVDGGLAWVTPQVVVGGWHTLWSWANGQLRNGDAPNVTEAWVDARVRLPGFAEAAQRVGWLRFTKRGMTIPNWEHWNSKSAKKRLLTARRMAEFRLRQSDADGVTKTSPEKRREESKISPPPPASGGGNGHHPRTRRQQEREQAAERERIVAAFVRLDKAEQWRLAELACGDRYGAYTNPGGEPRVAVMRKALEMLSENTGGTPVPQSG